MKKAKLAISNGTKKFQKKIEDFVCEKCGMNMKGSGYTNHCSNCLWSKHVDINPGDRTEKCRGMMQPIKIEFEKGKYMVTHKCIKCAFEKRKKVEKNDNFEEVIKISKE